MAVKKTTATTKTAAKAAKTEPVKAAEKEVKAAPAKAETAKAIETKKDTTKKLETKAAVLVDTPAEEKKAPAAKKKKTTAAKKTTAKKSTAKKAEIKTEMFLQFAGKEYSQEEIVQKVKDIWTYDLGKNVDEIKDVQLYLKPEESAAYYVVNGEESGKVIL